MPTFPPRAYKILAQHPPGTIYLPKIGPTNPASIVSFKSDGNYTWVQFRGKNKPLLISWQLALIVQQLPHWKLEKLDTWRRGNRRLKLVPAHS
ncbi:hypothetical protein [Spirosoma validum]|uniref:Uncharacterized protein n=1 Tax=Spirosoma validum TaxID=2771355 RepID=A0A927GDM1_9BACT|nr:hypothetical protein [Spirosoma validum]MBD2753818.1 hypothetical protein [Spirosoma validum]